MRTPALACVAGLTAAVVGCGGEPRDAFWRPASRPVDRDAAVLPIRIDEQTCSSGESESIPDRVEDITVRERADALVITVTVNSRSGDQTCEGAAPSPPVDVPLPAPIGDRAVIDGVEERVRGAADATRIRARR